MENKTNEQMLQEVSKALTDKGFDGAIVIGVKDNMLYYQSGRKGEKAFSLISDLDYDIMGILKKYGD